VSEQAGKTPEPKTTDTENSRRQEGRDAVASFTDNRPAAAAQRNCRKAPITALPAGSCKPQEISFSEEPVNS